MAKLIPRAKTAMPITIAVKNMACGMGSFIAVKLTCVSPSMGAVKFCLDVKPMKNKKSELSIIAILIKVLMICFWVMSPKRPIKKSIIESTVTIISITLSWFRYSNIITPV